MNETPVLAEVEALRIELGLAQLEAAQVKAQLLKTQGDALLADVNRRLEAARVEGFELRRQTNGQWTYVPVGGATGGCT